MKQIRFYPLLAATIIILSVSSVAKQNSSAPSSETFGKIEQLITKEMEQHEIVGLSIAISTDNKLRYAKGFGMADLENSVPAKEATVYRTASVAKSMTAVAIMQLAERGKLDLDTPIQTYCPAFPQKQWPVTARLLLGHLGGIRHYKNSGEETSASAYFTITDSLAIFKEEPLLYEPETKYNYTTFGYNVLGCALEGASGLSYENYMRQYIFQPAGMGQTGIDRVQALIPNRARGYTRLDEPTYNRLPEAAKKEFKVGEVYNAALHDTSGKLPGGGLVSTAIDLVKFAIALNTGKLVNEKSREQMWTRQRLKNGSETTYGLGWGVEQALKMKIVSHVGGQVGTSTYLLLIPDKGMAIGVMSNLQGSQLSRLSRQIVMILLTSFSDPLKLIQER